MRVKTCKGSCYTLAQPWQSCPTSVRPIRSFCKQTILQGACLNFLQIPVEVNKLLNTLRSKADQPMEPPTCYFAKLNDFNDISSRSAGVRFCSRSYEEFDIAKFNVTTVKPFIEALVKEIEEAFKIPEHLKGFTAIDQLLFPSDSTNRQDFAKEGINSLASFYGQANSDAETVVSPVVNGQALVHQYKGCKVYVMKYRNEWETNQNTAIILAEQKLKGLKNTKRYINATS